MPEPSKPNYTDSQARADVWVKGEAVTVFTAISGFFFSLWFYSTTEIPAYVTEVW